MSRQLMTSSAVTIHPDEEIVAEARAAAIDGVVAAHSELIVNPRSGRVTAAAGRAPCSGGR
jgi:hypothetical protein